MYATSPVNAVYNLQAGTECYCTDRMLRRAGAVADSVCNVPCPGDNLQNCGAAADYNAVYFVSPSTIIILYSFFMKL